MSEPRDLDAFLAELADLGTGQAPPPSAELAALLTTDPQATTPRSRKLRKRLAGGAGAIALLTAASTGWGAAAARQLPDAMHGAVVGIHGVFVQPKAHPEQESWGNHATARKSPGRVVVSPTAPPFRPVPHAEHAPAAAAPLATAASPRHHEFALHAPAHASVVVRPIVTGDAPVVALPHAVGGPKAPIVVTVPPETTPGDGEGDGGDIGTPTVAPLPVAGGKDTGHNNGSANGHHKHHGRDLQRNGHHVRPGGPGASDPTPAPNPTPDGP